MNKLAIVIASTFIFATSIAMHAHAGGVGGGNANSTWTIYGWQNWSYEWVTVEDENADGSDRDIQRIDNNAANIGFSASIFS